MGGGCVARLIVLSPFEDALPTEIGGLQIDEVDLGPVSFIQPLKGQADQVSTALDAALGHGLPGPGAAVVTPDIRLLWCGPGQVLLAGRAVNLPEGPPSAALVDVSDAFACARIEGASARDTLARLTPLDLRASVFGQGQTARTLVGHMTGQITPVGPEAFELMVFRSMAGTLIHELRRAAGFVAGRAALA